MKYDIIIVLCTEKKDPDGRFPEYKDGKYLGGQTRMNASVEVYKSNKQAEFIVVGGYNKKAERSKNGEESKKVEDMKEFLDNNCKNIIITPIKSLPCTRHNFVAIFNTWREEQKNLKDKKIGLLTNFYHLPRALKFSSELKNQEFKEMEVPDLIPISAESVITDLESDIYIRFIEYFLRLEDERKGLKDIEKNIYSDNCLERNFSEFEDLVKKYPNILLTQKEKDKYLSNN